MGPITIGFGVALTILGLWGYNATNRISVTALIPAFFGLAFVLLGQLAQQDNRRKLVMHLAAALGLIGLIIPAIMVGLALAASSEINVKVVELGLMALLCLAFVVLCIKSFIDARRRRQQENPPPGSQPP